MKWLIDGAAAVVALTYAAVLYYHAAQEDRRKLADLLDRLENLA